MRGQSGAMSPTQRTCAVIYRELGILGGNASAAFTARGLPNRRTRRHPSNIEAQGVTPSSEVPTKQGMLEIAKVE